MERLKSTDIIIINTNNKRCLAKRFNVSMVTVNAALRGATQRGNAELIRACAIADYPHHIEKRIN